MPVVNWGLLAKSLVDNEKIEEAINRLILVHEQDEASHLGAGESLQSHKASEIIDHLAASIILDKLAQFSVDFKKLVGDQYMLMTCFESIDGWNGVDWDSGGGISVGMFETKLFTGGTSTNFVTLATEPSAVDPVQNFAKNPFFQTSFLVFSNTSQTIFILSGDHTGKYFGFKILNGTLYAVNHNAGAETATEIPGVTITTYHIYRAELDSIGAEIRFYVDGVLKATHTTNLPTGTQTFIFEYWLRTDSAAVRNLYVRDLLWAQKK